MGTYSSSHSARHVPALDGVRGLAILMVIWAHFGPSFFVNAPGGWRLMLHNLLDAGWAGVDLFFVLSGFLITGILLDAKGTRRPDQGKSADAASAGTPRRPAAITYFSRFYLRRALRIFPLYYVVLAALAVSSAIIGNPSQTAIWHKWSPWLWLYAGNVYNARHGWMPGPNGLLLNHLWSLAVEEQFYLVWPIIVYACGRRALTRGCLGMILFAIGLRLYLVVIDGNNYAATLLMPCRIDAFAIGGLVAIFLPQRSGGHRSSALDSTRLGAVVAGVSACLLVPMFRSFIWMDVVGRTLFPAFFGGLILLAMFSPIRSAFEFTLLRLFGKYSYGIYVLHFLLYHGIDRCFPAARHGALVRFSGCTAVSFTLAWCSWHVIEMHFLKLKERVSLGSCGELQGLQRNATPKGISSIVRVELRNAA